MNLRTHTAPAFFLLAAMLAVSCLISPRPASAQTNTVTIDSSAEWSAAAANAGDYTIADGLVTPGQSSATFQSTVQTFAEKQQFHSLTFRQSAGWGASQWADVPAKLPLDTNGKPLGDDAPVFLSPGAGDYWYFNAMNDGSWQYGHRYQAWHSTDMVNWSERKDNVGLQINSAEYDSGEFFFHYGNDNDPRLLVDSNLNNSYADSSDRTNHGVLFDNRGSDVAAFRDLDGSHHIIYEDWSAFDGTNGWPDSGPGGGFRWDSPLAGHASSSDGVNGYVRGEHPYTIDTRTDGPKDVFGDYELIRVGDTYYLFGDYHPEGAGSNESKMSAAYWHSKDLYAEFEFGGLLRGNTHPDPTVGFAEGEFLMILQIDHQDGYEGDNKDLYGGEDNEYFPDKVATLTSAGPWVDAVEARAGVDTDGDGTVDVWTDWQNVVEIYGRIDGFAKVYSVDEAMLDLSALPDGYGIQFEFSTADMAAVMDSVSIESTTVPEPASMSLLALGGLGVLIRRRK